MDQPPTKYHHKTRIGNWSEEQEFEEHKLKDFRKNKELGKLYSTQLQSKMDNSLQKVSLTYSKDGKIHFGDHIMLLNKETDGYLVTDIYDPIKGYEEGYNTFTSNNIGAAARSVFILKKYAKDQEMFKDDVVHYGQKIQIQVNPLLIKKELHLHSGHITPQHVARFSRKQEVGLFAKTDYNTVWMIEHIDPKLRYETVGLPVIAGDAVLLKHCQTAQWLASDKSYVMRNDFGAEYEVFSHSFQTLNKTQKLISEKTGKTTIDMPSRNQKDQNCWALVVARDPEQEFDEAPLRKTLNVNDYLSLIRKKILQKGVYGFRSLLLQFKKLDANNVGGLDREAFNWGLKNYGVLLSLEELNMVFTAFDKNNNGLVDFQEFLDILKGPVSQKRQDLIIKAWSALVDRHGGEIRLDDVIRSFDARNHPDVLKGLITDKEAFREFATAWGTGDGDRPINYEDFYAYNADVSAGYEKDENFELLLHSVWHFK